MRQTFHSFAEFYPYYRGEHCNRPCRRLHFVGTTMMIFAGLYALLSLNPWYLLLMPLFGYGFAWAGHFFFEHNTPATFEHPWYSLRGDFVMYKDMLSGRISF